MTGAPAVIAGAVVEGSADGFLRAFDANTGELLFQYDTTQPLTTANGYPASAGPWITPRSWRPTAICS